MAAEFNRQDLFSDDLVQAPLAMAKDMEVLVGMMDKLAASAKGYEKSIGGASTAGRMKQDTEGLAQAQVELQKIQQQMVVVQAKTTEEYINQAKALDKMKVAQKEKSALGERDAKTVRAQNASHRVLEAALAKNKRAYKELTDEQARNSKEGKELLKIIQSQDKEMKALSGSIGEHQKNVGDYKNAILEALGPLGHFEGMLGPLGSGLRASGTAMQGVAKSANILKVALIAIPIFALIAAITSLVAYFTKTEDGAQKLRIIMAYVEEAFSGVVDLVIALGRWLSELSIDKVTQGFKDFGDTIKNFVLSRIDLLLQGVGGIGDAFALLFQGRFKDAAKTAGEAFVNIQRGMNPIVMAGEIAVDSFNAAKDAVVEWGKSVHAEAMTAVDLQKLENALLVERRKWLVEEERLAIQLNKAREKAADHSLTEAERIEALNKAERVLNTLEEKRLAMAIRERDIAVVRAALGETDEATLDRIAELNKQILSIEADRALQQRKITAQRSALEEKQYQDLLKIREMIRKRNDEDLKDAVKQAGIRVKARMDALQDELAQEQQMIQEAVLNGTITRKKGEQMIFNQRRAAAERVIEENIRELETQLQAVVKFNEQRALQTGLTEEEQNKIRTESAEEQRLIADQIAKLQIQLTDTVYQNMLTQHNQALVNTEEFLTQVLDIYSAFGQELGNLFAVLTENRLAAIEKEQVAFSDQTDKQLEDLEERQEGYDKSKAHELALFEKAEARKSEIENEAARRNEEFERKKIQAQRKQAIFDKAVSAIQAGIAGALAAVKALQTPPAPNVFAAGLAATLTAIQVGAILAKQIPAYAEGGIHKGGPMIVGERGPEMMVHPTGQLSLTPAHATLMTAPAGTVVIPNEDTVRMLARSGMSVTDYRPGSVVGFSNEFGVYFRQLIHEFRNKREVHYNWTRRGLERAFKHAENVRVFRDEFYK